MVCGLPCRGKQPSDYFSAEKESVCVRKKQVSVNSTGHSPDVKILKRFPYGKNCKAHET